MTESPDFVRNQDFFRIFVSNILLAIFSDPNADPNGRGLESTGQGQTGFFLSGPVFFCRIYRICWLMTPPMASAASCFIWAVTWA